jgi:nucleotide-binding universal stress UspA family protein
MYDDILVAVDGSPDAKRAVSHALEQAEKHGSDLYAIFVVDTEQFPEPVVESIDLDLNQLESWGQDELSAIEERGVTRDLDVTTNCCRGKPYLEICSYADDIDADLIVLGYRGRSEAKAMGSVADRVVRNAGRPVLVAP